MQPNQCPHADSCWGEDYWNGVLVSGSLRHCTVSYFTFLVNSATHLLGDQPYDSNLVAADSSVVNMLTGGEAYYQMCNKRMNKTSQPYINGNCIGELQHLREVRYIYILAVVFLE